MRACIVLSEMRDHISPGKVAEIVDFDRIIANWDVSPSRVFDSDARAALTREKVSISQIPKPNVNTELEKPWWWA